MGQRGCARGALSLARAASCDSRHGGGGVRTLPDAGSRRRQRAAPQLVWGPGGRGSEAPETRGEAAASSGEFLEWEHGPGRRGRGLRAGVPAARRAGSALLHPLLCPPDPRAGAPRGRVSSAPGLSAPAPFRYSQPWVPSVPSPFSSGSPASFHPGSSQPRLLSAPAPFGTGAPSPGSLGPGFLRPRVRPPPRVPPAPAPLRVSAGRTPGWAPLGPPSGPCGGETPHRCLPARRRPGGPRSGPGVPGVGLPCVGVAP